MNALKARIDRLAKIINKVRRVLLRRQREFVARICMNIKDTVFRRCLFAFGAAKASFCTAGGYDPDASAVLIKVIKNGNKVENKRKICYHTIYNVIGMLF